MSAIREAFIRQDIWETEDKEEEKRLKEQIRISVQHSVRALNTPQEDTGTSNYSNILLYIYVYTSDAPIIGSAIIIGHF